MTYKDKLKMTLAEMATNVLDKDKLENFMDFIAFVKENKMTLRRPSTYTWEVSYKKVSICTANLYSVERYKPDGSWSIRPNNHLFDDLGKSVTDADLQALILNAMNYILCRGCSGGQCMGRETLTIFGKEFSGVCSGSPIMIISPEGEALEHAKELTLITKKLIADRQS